MVWFVSCTPSAVQYRLRILLRKEGLSSLLFLQPEKNRLRMTKLWTVNHAAKEQFASAIHSPEKIRRLKILQYAWTSYYIHLHTKQRTSFLNHKNKVSKHANHGTALHKTMSSAEIFT